MQLGTRWSVGEEPPSRLSELMKAAISGVENERATKGTTGWRWTLTWLEGHPRAELDDGTVVREDHDGAILVETDEMDS